MILMEMVIIDIAMLLKLFIPVYLIVYIVAYRKNKVKYVRTSSGKKILERIYGMKNYIHDFSYLEEADKENIVLWEDFLVYAIVLEENSKIIEEICKFKKVNLQGFNNLSSNLVEDEKK